jgi:hypothetical protein
VKPGNINRFSGSAIWSWEGKNRRELRTLYYNDNGKLIYRLKMEKKTLEFVCEDPSSDTLIFER